MGFISDGSTCDAMIWLYCRNGTELEGLHIRVNPASVKPKVCVGSLHIVKLDATQRLAEMNGTELNCWIAFLLCFQHISIVIAV